MNSTLMMRCCCAFTTLLFFYSPTLFALPFGITVKAGTTLPIIVPVGSSANAYYTVRNLSARSRANNYLKYLPSNVTQVSSGGTYSDTCGSPFTLAAGASCTLQLSISSMTNGRSTNPRRHVVVCYPGGKTCAGPSDADSLYVGTDQFIYITDQGTNKPLTICNIDPGKNLIGMCRKSTPTFTGSRGIALNPGRTKAYVTNTNDIQVCNVSLTSGDLSNCVSSGGFANAGGVALNAAGTFAYVSDQGQTANFSCPINSTTGLLQACSYNSFGLTYGIDVSPDYGYLGTLNGSLFIVKCVVQSDNYLGSCARINGLDFSNNAQPGVTINPNHTFAYVSADNSVFKCAIDNTGDLVNCVSIFYRLSSSNNNLHLSSDGNYLFIPDAAGHRVFSCTGTDFANCTTINTTFDSPYGVYSTN